MTGSPPIACRPSIHTGRRDSPHCVGVLAPCPDLPFLDVVDSRSSAWLDFTSLISCPVAHRSATWESRLRPRWTAGLLICTLSLTVINRATKYKWREKNICFDLEMYRYLSVVCCWDASGECNYGVYLTEEVERKSQWKACISESRWCKKHNNTKMNLHRQRPRFRHRCVQRWNNINNTLLLMLKAVLFDLAAGSNCAAKSEAQWKACCFNNERGLCCFRQINHCPHHPAKCACQVKKGAIKGDSHRQYLINSKQACWRYFPCV